MEPNIRKREIHVIANRIKYSLEKKYIFLITYATLKTVLSETAIETKQNKSGKYINKYIY